LEYYFLARVLILLLMNGVKHLGGDSDSDDICDDVGSCVNSDLNANLVIDECDTSVANTLNGEG
jgi:hypothetical protein